MKKSISASKWIVSFFALVLTMCVLLSLAAYAVDPFFQFRFNSAYLMDSDIAGGLIKYYDYDTLILGSSITQNFRMNTFREELNDKPLHIGIGGISLRMIEDCMQTAYRAGHAETYYIAVDPYLFYDLKKHYPMEFYFQDGPVAKLRYFLNHKVWFHYLPLDLGLGILDRLGKESPLAGDTCSPENIDRFGDWSDKFEFGEEVVLDNYLNKRYSIKEIETDDLYSTMAGRIDHLMERLDFGKGKHVFFFPPYSSLYWSDMQLDGHYEDLIRAKRYFIEKAFEHGATVFDFQPAELTGDLNNYKDTTHYTPEINDWMVRCFANGEHLVTRENLEADLEQLKKNTDRFREAHMELLTEARSLERPSA